MPVDFRFELPIRVIGDILSADAICGFREWQRRKFNHRGMRWKISSY